MSTKKKTATVVAEKEVKTRVRSAAAKKEADLEKQENMLPQEHMTIRVTRADGTSRNRRWVECLVLAQKAAVVNVKENVVKRNSILETLIIAAIWLQNDGSVEWRGVTYGKSWSKLRLAIKQHIAKVHNAIAMVESADEITTEMQMMETVEPEQCMSNPWDVAIRDPHTQVKLLQFCSQYNGVSDFANVGKLPLHKLFSDVGLF